MLIADIPVGAWVMIALIFIGNIAKIVMVEHFFPTEDNRPRYVREIVIHVVVVTCLFGVWFFWFRK